MSRPHPSDDQELFGLQALEPRVMLSAEGFATAGLARDLALEALHTGSIFQSTIVETTAPAASSTSSVTAGSESAFSAQDDLFAVTLTAAAVAPATPVPTAARPTETTQAAPTPGLRDAAPAAVEPTVAAPLLKPRLPLATLPNGPPAVEETTSTPTQTDAAQARVVAPTVTTSAATDSLAATITSGLATLATQLPTWGSFFNLGSINWAAQGLGSLSLPVLPDTLGSLFDLGSRLGGVTLPGFASAENKSGLVTQMTGQGFTIRSIDGGFTLGSTTIAASTGTTLIEAGYTLSIASGFSIAPSFSGNSYNSATPSVLSGLASGTNLNGAISWTGSLSLTLNFRIDSASGFLLLGDSALTLGVSGTGSLNGSAAVGGTSGTTLTGTANAALTIALGFRDAAATYTPSQFTGTNLTATASGTAGLTLAFKSGPVSLTFGASYTLTANLATRATSQAIALTLTGQLDLPGVQTAAGTPGSVTLTGAFTTATNTWTITGSATGLRMFGQTLDTLTASAAITSTTFSGTFASQLTLDFLSNGSSPAVLRLSATYDQSTVSIAASATIATLNVGGTGSSRLLALTGPTLAGTFTGNIATGALTGSITFNATSATFQPDQSTYSATITDGSDADPYGLAGSYDFSTQVFKFDVDQFAVAVASAFRATASGMALNFDRKSTDAAQVLVKVTTATLELTALASAGGSTPPSFKLSGLTVRQNGFAFDNLTGTFGDVTVGGGILRITAPGFTLNNVSYTTGAAPVGTLGLTAASATLFPAGTSNATLTTLSGQFDFATLGFSITIQSLAAKVGSVLTFTGSGLTFGYQPTGPPSQTIITADSLSAAFPSGSLSATLTGLAITADGNFRGRTLTVDTSGLAKTLGLGELLPFQIDSLTAVFRGTADSAGRSDLSTFDLTVRGAFDFAKLSSLPFTPIIRIGPAGANQQTFAKDTTQPFEFTVTVSGSSVTPKDIGPITVGFADLKIGGTVILGGTITLGGYVNSVFQTDFGGTFTLQKTGAVSSINGNATATLAGSFDTATRTVAATGSLTVSFTYGDKVQIQNARLGFDFTMKSDSATGFTVSVPSVSLTSGSVDSVTLNFGSLLRLSATTATFDFTATGKNAVATFGSLTATFPDLAALTGTAKNFGFAADGSLLTLDGFGVSINAQAGDIKWPSWLPIRITNLSLAWKNFAADPLDFAIDLSAEFSTLNGLSQLTVAGSVTHAVIDIGLLKQGKFPVTDLGGFALTLQGSAFGGTVGGTLILNLLKVDAAGNLIDDTTTPVDRRVLYGAVEAKFDFGGMSGFDLRIGLSELGPLQLYVSVSQVQILEPISGLAISNFRAGVTFNNTLDPITDPLKLRGGSFKTQDQLTLADWQARLRGQVLEQLRTNTSFWSSFTAPMRIEGGATLFSAYAGEGSFRADADIIFDTQGRVLLNVRGTFGGTVSLNFRLYADLTKIKTTGTFLFLADLPDGGTAGIAPVLTIRGGINFKFLQADGVTPATAAKPASQFYLSVTGGADATLLSVGQISLEAALTLRFTSDRFTADFTGTLNFGPLGKAVSAAGQLTVLKTGNNYQVWGGAVLRVDQLDVLAAKGVFASGTAILRLNTSNLAQTVSLALPGSSPQTYALPAQSFSVAITGALRFQQAGRDWFTMSNGTFAFTLSPAGADVALKADLEFGGTGASATLTLSLDGYMALRADGFALKLDAALKKDFAASAKMSLSGSFRIMLNTTGHDVGYVLPPGVTIDGSSIVSVPGFGPGATSAGAYLLITATGTLVVDGKFTFEGTFSLLVAPGLTRLAASAKVDLSAGSKRLFTFTAQGSIEIDAQGSAGWFTLAIASGGGLPSDAGFSVNGSFAVHFEFNSHAVAVTTADTPSRTLAPSTTRFVASGQIAVEGVTFDGTFTFQKSGDVLLVGGTFDTKIGDGGKAWLTLSGSGDFVITSAGLAARLTLTLKTGPAASDRWSIRGTFGFQLNTTSAPVAIPGNAALIPAAITEVVIANAVLTVGSFELDGNFTFTHLPGRYYITGQFTTTVSAGTKKLFTLAGGASFSLYSDGFIGRFSLGFQTGSSATPQGETWSLQAAFEFDVNTMNRAVTIAGVDVPANFIQLKGTGKIVLRDAFTLEGTFVFTKQATTVTISANFSVKFYLDAKEFLTLTGQGGLEVSTAGTAGYFALQTNTGGGRGASGTGWSLDAAFSFRMNTGTAPVTIGSGTPNSITLAPGIGVHAQGTLTVADFALNGTFDLSVNAAGDFIMAADFGFTLKAGSVQLFTFTGKGDIKIRSDGIVVGIGLFVGANQPDAKQGWTFSGGFNANIQINTRNTSDVGGNFLIPAHYASVRLDGVYHFGNAFSGRGSAIFTVQNGAFSTAFDLVFAITAGSTTVFTLGATGTLAIDSTGTAGKFALTFASDAAKTSSQGWTLDASLGFEFNTRSTAVAGIAAHTVRVTGNGTLTYRFLALQGSFVFTASTNGLNIAANVAIDFERGGTKILGFSGHGTLALANDGLYGRFDLSFDANVPSAHGWSFDAKVTSTFEINTSATTHQLNGRALAPSSTRVAVSGDLLAASFTIRGDFVVAWAGRDSLQIAASAHLRTFNTDASVTVTMEVRSDGLVFDARLDLPKLDYHGFQIKGTFELGVNTSSTAARIPARSAFLSIDQASLELAGVTLSGSITISSAGVITIPDTDPLRLSVARLDATISGTLDLEARTYSLTGSLDVKLGSRSIAAIEGSSTIRINHQDGARIAVKASLWAFDYAIGSVDGDLYLTSDGFAFDVGFGFTSGVAGFHGSGSFYTRHDGSVRVTFAGTIYLYGLSADAHGFCDTRTGEWAAKASISASFGDDNLGASIGITALVGNTTYEECDPGLWFGAKGWAQWHGIGISGSLSGKISHDSVSIGVDVGVTTVTIYINLNNGDVHLSQVSGATVFLDVNRNGLLDPGEPTTLTNDVGGFNFRTPPPVSTTGSANAALGGLAVYDLNRNGVLDASEGRLLLLGGAHFVDGLPAVTPVILPARGQGLTDYRGATVFFDTNGNNRVDAGELSVTTTSGGTFSFIGVAPPRDSAALLGLLAPYDLNHDGVISPTEGRLVALGGTYLAGSSNPVGSAATTTLLIGQDATGTGRIARAGAAVFLDLNGNRLPDAGEPATLTDSAGSYTFIASAIAAKSAALGALGRYDTNQNGLLESSEGRLRFTGGTRLANATDIPIDSDHPAGYLAFAGATVWFDANNNSRIDAGEVATTTTATGFYNFLADGTPVRDGVSGAAIAVTGPSLTRSLGALAAFDKNGNGIIDDAEGVFVITGGVDVNTGQPNTRTLTVPADTYGSLSGTTATPLSELYYHLRLLGLDALGANARLQTAFGLPSTTDVRFLSPRSEADAGSGLADDIETISKHISFFVRTGAEMLMALAESGGNRLAYAAAEDAIETELARRIATLATAIPFARPGPPALALASAELIKGAFAQAAATLNLALPFSDRLDVVAAALGAIEARVGAMRNASLAEITEALARLQATLHDQFFPAVRDLFAQRATPAAFAARFSADAMRDLVRTAGIPTRNDPPAVSAIASQTRHDDPARVTVVFTARDPDGLASDIDVVVASSNPALLPASGVRVSHVGDVFTLELTRVPARTGTAVITVNIDDGHQANAITRTFTVTVAYRYAEVMNDLAIRARHVAEDEERRAERAESAAPALPGLASLFESVAVIELTATVAAPVYESPLVAATSLAAGEFPHAIQKL